MDEDDLEKRIADLGVGQQNLPATPSIPAKRA